MLSHRIISALLFFVFFFLGLFQPYFFWVLPILLAAATFMGLVEFVHFGTHVPSRPFIGLALIGAAALLLDAYFYPIRYTLPILGFLTIFSLGLGTLRMERHFLEVAGKCLIGTLYVTLPLALIMEIWRIGIASDTDNGQHYLIFLVLVTQASDIGAYFTGRAIGKHKLAPRLSPGKSVEGFIGGIVFTLLVAVLFKLLWNNMNAIFGWWEIVFLSLVFSTVGPLGDLTESWFKRNTQIKDSGRTFTGHGGMLDIIDSLLFTTIFYYVYLWVVHPNIIH